MNLFHPLQPGALSAFPAFPAFSAISTLVGLVLVLGGSPSQAAIEANQASQAELETVTGIGPNLSARILQARHDQAFRDWEDLLKRVSGLGSANAVKLSRAGLTVGGAPFSDPAKVETQVQTSGARASARNPTAAAR